MTGTDGRGTGSGGASGHARGDLAGPLVGDLVVDVAVLDEGAARLVRAGSGLRDAGAGLDRLPVAAVATGSDALLDALADLGRQWSARLGAATAAAEGLAAALRTASAAYAQAERAAADPLGALLGAFDLTAAGPPERAGRDEGPQ